MIYYLDIPKYPLGGDEEWISVDTFKTRQEAIDFITKWFGPNEDGKIQLISEGDDEEN